MPYSIYMALSESVIRGCSEFQQAAGIEAICASTSNTDLNLALKAAGFSISNLGEFRSKNAISKYLAQAEKGNFYPLAAALAKNGKELLNPSLKSFLQPKNSSFTYRLQIDHPKFHLCPESEWRMTEAARADTLVMVNDMIFKLAGRPCGFFPENFATGDNNILVKNVWCCLTNPSQKAQVKNEFIQGNRRIDIPNLEILITRSVDTRNDRFQASGFFARVQSGLARRNIPLPEKIFMDTHPSFMPNFLSRVEYLQAQVEPYTRPYAFVGDNVKLFIEE